MAVRMSVGSVVGGIAAEITGGDFADGAAQGVWTSAFAYVVQALTGGGATHKEVEKELPESWRGPAVLEGVDREVALGGLGASAGALTSRNQAVAAKAETALTTEQTGPGYWERVFKNWVLVNKTQASTIISGVAGIPVSSALAKEMGAVTFTQWARAGFRGLVMSGARFTVLETGITALGTEGLAIALTMASYEVGLWAGSMIYVGAEDILF